ncbi:hypothetical protein L211DRAFT_845220 [Terfezia boudieri ATCC MYA-4762]|uniref:RNA-dependent RNA polymerase n=1 Tax=Terfezia boudieri ATCC MYA-4762 TaxID=1051890 RepID=A0A3N4M5U7_9PEZI|nr:hypothetical protein L211DRAFT_845220 [Terfezia boudieri ATCC MYA-4762]
MTGSIEFNTSPNRTSFSIRLNALPYQSLNRFWRKYGSDRFLTVRLPSPPNANHLPRETPYERKAFCRTPQGFHETLVRFLMQEDQISPDPLNPRLPGDPYTPDPNVRNIVGDVEGEIMDDGCSFASPAVFRKIQEQLGLKEAPTAVQGRLGGAKGSNP